MRAGTVPATCVVGLQWGDEAKGKVVDLLTQQHDIVVRYQGGANAGHTVVTGGQTYKLSLVPSGIFRPEVQCVVASGVVLSFTSMTTGFVEGYTVTGGTSGATGTAAKVLTTSINVKNVTGTFVSGETITGIASATANVQSTPVAQTLVSQYQHEVGYDKTLEQQVTPIVSSFTSCNFGIAVGTPFDDAPKTMDIMTRIERVEPDLNQVGDVTLSVIGRSFAQDPDTVLNTYTLTPTDSFQNTVDQQRILKLKFESDALGGFYEQGQIMVKISPGDERSSK